MASRPTAALSASARRGGALTPGSRGCRPVAASIVPPHLCRLGAAAHVAMAAPLPALAPRISPERGPSSRARPSTRTGWSSPIIPAGSTSSSSAARGDAVRVEGRDRARAADRLARGPEPDALHRSRRARRRPWPGRAGSPPRCRAATAHRVSRRNDRDGRALLPFRSTLLGRRCTAAARRSVRPVALDYGDSHRRRGVGTAASQGFQFAAGARAPGNDGA